MFLTGDTISKTSKEVAISAGHRSAMESKEPALQQKMGNSGFPSFHSMPSKHQVSPAAALLSIGVFVSFLSLQLL